MKALVQRVTKASVVVNGEVISSIGNGLCVLIGIKTDDTIADAEYIAEKLLKMRVFDGAAGKRWALNVMDKEFEILCVSQFTLYHILKGNKLDFHRAMSTSAAETFYKNFLEELKRKYKPIFIKVEKQENFNSLLLSSSSNLKKKSIKTDVNIDSDIPSNSKECETEADVDNDDSEQLIRQLSRQFSNSSISSEETKVTKLRNNYDFLGTSIVSSTQIVCKESIISELVYQYLLNSMDKQLAKNDGNYQFTSSTTVIRKARSQELSKNDCDTNDIIDVILRLDNYDNNHPYIRKYELPFSIYLGIDEQIEFLKEHPNLKVHLDATGSVVRLPYKSSKQVVNAMKFISDQKHSNDFDGVNDDKHDIDDTFVLENNFSGAIAYESSKHFQRYLPIKNKVETDAEKSALDVVTKKLITIPAGSNVITAEDILITDVYSI
ncbi:hypothetical protein G9C98_003170 [Cotesia typhae]|uniref:D-aminoacyl-tRNA deacylase n=1 Tax=Cotesia typhae TaxID=2053667 RepID=A0A8J5QR68_9HYME|nr:hypothetical protein G9C98_003170 [Cotesia typhae]